MIFNFTLFLLMSILYIILTFKNNSDKRQKVFLIIAVSILFLLVALRDESMGNDTIKYLDLYSKCAKEKWNMHIFGGYYEPGYLVFNILLSYISPSRRFFMVIMSFLFNVAVYRFIKNNSKNYLLSILAYIGLLFFYSSMTMMRQFLAMSLVLESIRFAQEKKLIPFIIIIILALTMHSTAILAIMIYPIFNIKYKPNRVLIILASSVVATLFIGSIYTTLMAVLGRNSYYVLRIGNSENITSVTNFTIYSIINILLIRSIKNNKPTTSKNTTPYIYSATASSAISIMATRMNILSRADDYYSILLIAGIPNMIEELHKKRNKKTAKLLFITFLIAFSSTIIIMRPEWNTAYNYKPCFSTETPISCLK